MTRRAPTCGHVTQSCRGVQPRGTELLSKLGVDAVIARGEQLMDARNLDQPLAPRQPLPPQIHGSEAAGLQQVVAKTPANAPPGLYASWINEFRGNFG